MYIQMRVSSTRGTSRYAPRPSVTREVERRFVNDTTLNSCTRKYMHRGTATRLTLKQHGAYLWSILNPEKIKRLHA